MFRFFKENTKFHFPPNSNLKIKYIAYTCQSIVRMTVGLLYSKHTQIFICRINLFYLIRTSSNSLKIVIVTLLKQENGW